MPPSSPVATVTRRTGQLLTGLGALVVLIALLAGTPIALLAFAGNPLPEQLPTLEQIGTALTSRDDGQLFLSALALVGWAGWATFALSVLVEVPARILRRPAPRLPGMRRQQRMAATLLGSVALILAVAPAATAASSLATAPAVTTSAPGTQSAHASATTAAQNTSPGEPVYRVEQDDYLGHIAARYLGDFDRYPELAKQNKIRNADRIRPGQLLRLPTDAADRGVRQHATGLVAMPKPPGAPPQVTPPAPSAPPAAVPIPVQPPGAPDEVSLAGGAAGPGRWDSGQRPLAVSAVIAAASVVGAQIGAALGLRRRTVRTRDAGTGRHRLDP